MTSQVHGNNRPIAFTGKPTMNQFMRYLTEFPPVTHQLYVDYREMRRIRTQGSDNFGSWLRERYPGAFRVMFAKVLNNPKLWEEVWSA